MRMEEQARAWPSGEAIKDFQVRNAGSNLLGKPSGHTCERQNRRRESLANPREHMIFDEGRNY
jgi:hypothetical protein